MKKYKCTRCNHVFDKRFKCGTSETALCPSCFAGAEMVADLKAKLDERNDGHADFDMDNKQIGLAD